jgi:two-component system phosphate regulon sensor histidine kinase PhoR
LPDAAIPVRGSRHELGQVFVNLIENAIKYAGQGGPIRISLRIDGERAVVSVADSGPGIEAEHIPRLTERFFRVNPVDSRAKSGTGLGLAIVKHIVNRHRGTLGITSKPREGAVFKVFLPLIQP